MFIVIDHPTLASSGGATNECIYVAPPELAINIVVKVINIRLLRSRSESIDNNHGEDVMHSGLTGWAVLVSIIDRVADSSFDQLWERRIS